MGSASSGTTRSADTSSPPANAARRRATLSRSAMRSSCRRSRSAAFTVGSTSISRSPDLTDCPSCTWIARTTPVSNGWTTLLRPLDTTLPVAEATMSIVPQADQASAAQTRSIRAIAMARPIGDGGVSVISSAAGRKATSLALRPFPFRNGITVCSGRAAGTVLADLINASLETMQGGVPAAGLDQRIMRAVLDQTAAFQGEDAIGAADGGQTVRDDQDGAAFRDLLHVVMDDPLAFIVERAGGFVEDQDPGIAYQRTGDRDALALPARERRAALADHRIVALGELQNEIMSARQLRRVDDAVHRQAWIGQRDVVAHRPVEQHVVLEHDSDLPTEPGRVGRHQIHSVDQHAAGLRNVEPLHQLGEGAFARAGRSDNADGLPGWNVE